MQIAGTRQAFAEMIKVRGIYKRLGVERSTVSTWKIYIREGKNISLDKMEEMLIKGGSTVVSDIQWQIPDPTFRENMIDFHDELEGMKDGDTLTVDYRPHVSEILVKNAIVRHLEKNNLTCKIDESNRPIVIYYFSKK